MSRINVDIEAFTDPRFGQLAKLLGLADADHARSKVEYLWMACTMRGETDLPAWLVEQHLGERGPDALVGAELARWGAGRGDSNTRRMYICGSEERTLWKVKKEEQSSKGGKARASTASRDGGKFTRTPGATAGAPPPAETSAPSPSPSPSPSQEDQRESARAIPRTGTGTGAHTIPTASPESSLAPVPDRRIKLNHDAYSYAREQHLALKREGIDANAISWPGLPSGVAANELPTRTNELLAAEPNFDGALAKHRHRVDVAVAEARRQRHLRWFTPSRFYASESFWRAIETSVEQAGAPIDRSPPPPPRPKRVGPEPASELGDDPITLAVLAMAQQPKQEPAP